jgi:maltooligosyltrehalose trehalohydrolase
MNDPRSQLIQGTDAEPLPPPGACVTRNGVSYRVWAPDHQRMRVSVKNARGEWMIEMDAREDGFFVAIDPAGEVGDRYLFEVDGRLLPDPASRYQPEGVAGPSQVIAPVAYNWTASDWRRPLPSGRVIYELHVGTFTPEGTFSAAIEKLDFLADLGVNTIELMPLADFPGERNWGYDGVMIFAPARCYGTPDDLRALIDAAHLRGLAVVVDVVYNHIGPSGNVLPEYARGYFRSEKTNTWGKAFDYRNPSVRHFFLQNACMWFDEYRVDGLRIDAVHAIDDDSPRHLVAEIAEAAHARDAWIIAEDERNEANLIMPARQNGWGVDAVWSDDFHHTVRVSLTGQQESHFKSYTGSIDEWVKTLTQGWFYDGQFFPHWKRPRGTPAGHMPPERFVFCISNHDQVGNRPLGDRLHHGISPEAYRAVSMLLCLTPYTPMLFMGQEWGAGTPFTYFTDLPGDVGANMRKSRIEEFNQYGAHYDHETLARMPDPQDKATFSSAKLDWTEYIQPGHAETLSLYRECLRLRAREWIFQSPPRDRWSVSQIVDRLLCLRWHHHEGDWLLLIGIAADGKIIPMEEPCMQNRPDHCWRLVLASNEPRVGGSASHILWHENDRGFYVHLPGCVLLRETGNDSAS